MSDFDAQELASTVWAFATVDQLNAELFAPFLAEAGLDERILHAPDVEIPAAKYAEFWEILGRRVDASIGLRIGIQTVSTTLGIYGQAVRSAPTMLLALRCLSHFVVVFSQAIRVDVEIGERQVILSYQVTDPTIVRRRQDSEFTIGFFLSLCLIICRCTYPLVFRRIANDVVLNVRLRRFLCQQRG